MVGPGRCGRRGVPVSIWLLEWWHLQPAQGTSSTASGLFFQSVRHLCLSCPPWHCCPGPWQVPRPLLHPDLWQEFGPWRGGGVGRRSELASFSSCCKGLGAARFCEPLRLLKELGTRRYGQFQAHLWPLLPGELTVLEGPGSLPSFQVSSLLTLLASTVGGGTVLGHCLPSGRRGQKEDDLARRGQRPESWEGHLCLRLPAPAAGREAAGCSPRGWPQTRALFPSMRPAAH